MSGDVEMRPEPKDTDWIRITSLSGFSFLVKRQVVNTSGTLKNMLDTDSNFAEGITKTCPIEERPIIVEKLLEYMSFRAYYEKAGTKDEVPVHEYMERVPPEIVLELLLAADYQDV